MKNMYIMVGPPGSGKSHYSKWMIQHESTKQSSTFGGSVIMAPDGVRISQDDQGKQGHMEELERALQNNVKTIVIDRMNFNKKQRSKYIKKGRANGYQIHVVTFYTPRDICLDRCTKRENHPTIHDTETAAKVIDFFFKSYEPADESECDSLIPRWWSDPNISFDDKPDAVIFDIDGTLANIEHRRHYTQKNGERKPNWQKFFESMVDDTVNEWCRDLMNMHRKAGRQIILATGRPADYNNLTVQWLYENKILADALLMRSKGDYRKDSLVKEDILDFELIPRYNILYVVDDRTQVVEMWRKRGITCLQCDEGNF